MRMMKMKIKIIKTAAKIMITKMMIIMKISNSSKVIVS
jgi:hypothetical protein